MKNKGTQSPCRALKTATPGIFPPAKSAAYPPFHNSGWDATLRGINRKNTMTIQQENTKERGRFFIEENDRELALMTYTWKPDVMVIEHTEVDDSLGGQGIGKKLVAAAVDYARAQHVRIYPVCPYAKKVLERSPEYADVLKPGTSDF